MPAVLLAGGPLARSQEPPATPPAAPKVAPAAPNVAPAKPKLYNNTFRSAPWQTVFDWFERESGLKILSADIPGGTVTMTVENKTLPEVIDLINDVLGQKQYVMLRGSESFRLFAVDKKIPNEYLQTVTPETLDKLGNTEWVRVTVQLPAGNIAEVVPQLANLKSQFGDVTAIGDKIVITDKAATARQIVKLVKDLDRERDTFTHTFEYLSAVKAAADLRTQLKDPNTTIEGGNPATATPPGQFQGFDPRQFQGGDGRDGRRGNPAATPEMATQTVQVTTNETANTVTVSGPIKKILEAKEYVKQNDKPAFAGQKPRPASGQPTAITYSVQNGTAEAFVKFLQGRYADSKVTSVQPIGTDRVLVVALPADHLDIAQALKGQDTGVGDIETKLFTLNSLDLTKTAETLTKALGGAGLTAEARTDGLTPGILVRGTAAQLKEAADICGQLGERPANMGGGAGTGALNNPTTRTIVIDRGNTGVIAEGIADLVRKLRPRTPVELTVPGAAPLRRTPKADGPLVPGDQSKLPNKLDPKLVVAQNPDAPKPKGDKPAANQSLSIVVVGNRIYLRSDDPAVLDLATQLARSILTGSGEDIYEVIRLKNVSAEAAAKVLSEVFNGPAQPAAQQQQGGRGGRGGGFNPLSLLGLGGGGEAPNVPGGPTPGRVRLVADPVSNSLIVVKATPSDLLQLRSLLVRAIDYEGEPEGGVAKTRTIQLKYATATAVRDAVNEVFRNKTTRASVPQEGGNPFRPPQQVASGPAELSVYADEASNRLVVNSTLSDFQAVEALARELDKSTQESVGVVRVVQLQGLSPTQVKTAVDALTGGKPADATDNSNNPFGGRGNNRGGRGRNRGNQSSNVRPGGRDFFDSRGTDAPNLTRPLFDPALASLLPMTDDTPSVFRTAFDNYNATSLILVQTQDPPDAPPNPVVGAQSVQPPPAGKVVVIPLEDLGAVIIRAGTQADIDEVIKFIALLRQKTESAEIAVRTVQIKVADASELTDLIVRFYQRVQLKSGTKTIIAAPEEQFRGIFNGFSASTPQTVGNLVIFTIPRFNQVVVAAPKSDIDDILKQIEAFDKPNNPDLRPVRYPLTKASAQVVARQLTSFFSLRYPGAAAGLTSFTADTSSNSVLVQAAPGDQAEVAELIRALDTQTSSAVNEVEVIRLKNAFAGELAQVINQAISVSVINPLTTGQTGGQGNTVQGGFGPVQFGGGGGPGGGGQGGGNNQNQNNQGNQQRQGQFGGATGSLTGITTKTTTLRFAGKGLPVESGALEDVHVVPVERVNGLLIAAPPKTMELIKRLVTELDVVAAAQSNVNVFTLKKADAVQVAGLIQQLFAGTARTATGGGAGGLGGGQGGFGGGQGGFGGGFGGQQGGGGGQQGTQGFIRPLLTLTGNPSDGANLIDLRLAADPRTNTIIAAGSQNDLQTINAIIARIDDAEAPAIVPQVYKLRNAAAADVAQAVTNFVTSQAQLINSQFSATATFQTLQRNLVVVAEPVSNTLLISATPQLSSDIGRLIAQLDATPPQVLVQVLIAEVTLNNAEEFGVELGFQSPILFTRSLVGTTPGTPGFNFNSTAPLPNSTAAIPGQVGFQGLGNLGVGRAGAAGVGGFVFSAASDSVSVLVRALKVQSRIDVLSRPQLVLTDNQQGFFQVGQSYPYIAGTTLTATGLSQQSVLYRDIGVVLRVVPRISPEGRVLLRVEPQVSAVSPVPVTVGVGVTAPAFDVQTLQTTVNAGDGETVILGGLIRKSDTKTENKIPVLGDIPYVGSLFRYRTQNLQRRELIFILTPHIIRNELDYARLTAIEACKAEYNRRDVVGIHTFGADVLAGPCGLNGGLGACSPFGNPTLGAPAGFPYNSPAMDPAAPGPIQGLPPGAVVQPDGTVMMPSPPPTLLSPQATGFPLRNASGTPTPFAPPGTPNQLPQDATVPAAADTATTPKEGKKPWNWSVFGK